MTLAPEKLQPNPSPHIQELMSIRTIIRRPLLKAEISRTLTSVDVREITFAPDQQTGRHRHPCPVVG